MEEYSVWKPPTSSVLRLGQVEGRPGQLGRDGDHEEDEGQEAEPDQVPVPEPVRLRRHDGPGRERAGHQHDHHRGHAERGLVGDHLGRGPHRAEQRVLRARGPAGQHDAVDGDARHGQHEQDPHGRVGHLQLEGVAADGDDAADRDDGEDQHGRDDREVRRQLEDEGVGPVGQQVLLEDELGPVGQRLQQAPRPGPVRARPGSACPRSPCARTRSSAPWPPAAPRRRPGT